MYREEEKPAASAANVSLCMLCLTHSHNDGHCRDGCKLGKAFQTAFEGERTKESLGREYAPDNPTGMPRCSRNCRCRAAPVDLAGPEAINTQLLAGST